MTAIGDAVNLASRIEAANKQVGTTLLISQETYAEVKDLVTINQRCSVTIPGKSGEYVVYEVTGIATLVDATPVIASAAASRSLLAVIKQWLHRCWRSMQQRLRHRSPR